MTLLHIHREILELDAKAENGPMMPPPTDIEAPVRDLIERGLLEVSDGIVMITPASQKAVSA